MFDFNRAVFMSETGGGSPAPGGAPAADPPSASAQPVAFAETLPEDIRGEAAFRDIKDLGALAKSYLNATKMIGGRPEDLVRLPGPDDVDGWNGVFTKLGRPESPDKYQFTAPKLPEGVQLDEKLQGAFAEMAHKTGLTTKQAAALYDWYNTETVGRLTASAQETTAKAAAAEAALKTEWGAAYETNLNLAKSALTHYGDDKVSAELIEKGLGNNPEVIKLFAKLGKQLSEDGLLGKGVAGQGGLSPAEAKQQIHALHQDEAFMKAYRDAKAPGHQDAVKKIQQFYEYAYPQEQPAR